MIACLALAMTGCGDGPTEPEDLDFAAVTAGISHTCAITSTAEAYCWGSNARGQLGAGDSHGDGALERVAGGLRFTSLSAGAEYTCGVVTGGAAYCWGRNDDGQLGNGTRTPHQSTPVRASGLTFESVTAGAHHTCGRTTSGVAYCWGRNEYGELGDGTETDRLSPTAVVGSLTFASVEASHFHTCGLTTAGAAYCWGADDGRLGDGSIDNVVRPIPSRVNGDLLVASLGTTHGAHICGLESNDAARCWGWNESGQLGDGTTTARLGPAVVAGGHTFRTVGAGGTGYTCGLTTAGAAYCWGANDYGQLGDGTETAHVVAAPVSGGLAFIALGVGAAHNCGVTTDGEIYCWGANQSGQLGTMAGNESSRSATPIRVPW